MTCRTYGSALVLVWATLLALLAGCVNSNPDLVLLAEKVPVLRVETYPGENAKPQMGQGLLLPNGNVRIALHQLFPKDKPGEPVESGWIRLGEGFFRYKLEKKGHDWKHGDDWAEIAVSPNLTVNCPPLREDFVSPVPVGTPVYLIADQFTWFGDETPPDESALRKRAVPGVVIAPPQGFELRGNALPIDTEAREKSYRASGGAVVRIDSETKEPVVIGTFVGPLWTNDPKDPKSYRGQVISRLP